MIGTPLLLARASVFSPQISLSKITGVLPETNHEPLGLLYSPHSGEKSSMASHPQDPCPQARLHSSHLLDPAWLLHRQAQQFVCSNLHEEGVENSDLFWVDVPDERGLFPETFPHLGGRRSEWVKTCLSSPPVLWPSARKENPRDGRCLREYRV